MKQERLVHRGCRATSLPEILRKIKCMNSSFFRRTSFHTFFKRILIKPFQVQILTKDTSVAEESRLCPD
jgi:hypothetical protein